MITETILYIIGLVFGGFFVRFYYKEEIRLMQEDSKAAIRLELVSAAAEYKKGYDVGYKHGVRDGNSSQEDEEENVRELEETDSTTVMDIVS